ncbi:hypothetical protein ALC62_14766 [Cyphomyrmex costatus]|uniref:Uncharacterized protein n=1 Tax=Cyphomyrmex costatus TaxID=456900 RepID=A0A151I8I9_9HYME|nr:hypothetical protein ALC62_14766 [Cyphomyrmex costatus]
MHAHAREGELAGSAAADSLRGENSKSFAVTIFLTASPASSSTSVKMMVARTVPVTSSPNGTKDRVSGAARCRRRGPSCTLSRINRHIRERHGRRFCGRHTGPVAVEFTVFLRATLQPPLSTGVEHTLAVETISLSSLPTPMLRSSRTVTAGEDEWTNGIFQDSERIPRGIVAQTAERKEQSSRDSAAIAAREDARRRKDGIKRAAQRFRADFRRDDAANEKRGWVDGKTSGDDTKMMGVRSRRNDWKPDSGAPLVGRRQSEFRSQRGRKGPNDPELRASPRPMQSP